MRRDRLKPLDLDRPSDISSLDKKLPLLTINQSINQSSFLYSRYITMLLAHWVTVSAISLVNPVSTLHLYWRFIVSYCTVCWTNELIDCLKRKLFVNSTGTSEVHLDKSHYRRLAPAVASSCVMITCGVMEFPVFVKLFWYVSIGIVVLGSWSGDSVLVFVLVLVSVFRDLSLCLRFVILVLTSFWMYYHGWQHNTEDKS